MKKILITGVFSSGKTSLIHLINQKLKLLDKEVIIYSEVARECPFDLNLNQNNISTSWLVMRQIENEINGSSQDCQFCIYDRGLPDIISHAGYVLKNCEDDLIFYDMLKNLGKASLSQFDYIFIARRSDNFPIETDGLRINDTDFQKNLEQRHIEYLNEVGLRFIVLPEKNEDRVNEVLSKIIS